MVGRIRVARDKSEFVQSLVSGRDRDGMFQTYADLLVFAAMLGIKAEKRVPVEIVSKEPAPVGLDIFISRGYDRAIKLVAIVQTGDPAILSAYNPHSEDERMTIFEEYANGGLEVLQEELRGAVDYTERLLLLLNAERFSEDIPTGEFDLTQFL
ncbi:MAG: DNA phosphorothioation-associated protein 4 [Cyanobacteria bacterium SBLK]|nr:DNA phosphorothioation-associated protein 4 [Cyanobacteria bacterium SBLK]